VCTPEEFLAAEPEERRRLVIAQVEADPDQHDQALWIEVGPCGTSGCIAGWTCLLAGDEPIEARDRGKGYLEYYTVITADGNERDIEVRAMELLGADNGHGFYCGRDAAIEWLRGPNLALLDDVPSSHD
jgi:hypothetical protein